MVRRIPSVVAHLSYLCADLTEPHRQMPALWTALQDRLRAPASVPRVEVAAPLDFETVSDLVQRLAIEGPPHRLLHLAADLVASGASSPRWTNSWDASCWADVDTALGDGWLRIHVARDLTASEANPQHRSSDHWPPPESRRHVVMALRLPLDLGPPERIRLQILRPRPCFDKPGRPLIERHEVVPPELAATRRAAILKQPGGGGIASTKGRVRIPDDALVVLHG